MKLFDWVHKKLRPNPTDDNRAVSDQCIFESHEKSPDKGARVKTGHEDRSASPLRRLAAASFASAEARNNEKIDTFSQNIQSMNAEQEDLALLVRDIQHGLFAIGTLGMSNRLTGTEELKFSEKMYFKIDSEVSSTEVLEVELEVELEKVFHAQIEHYNVDLNATKVILQADEKDPKKEEKHHKTANERKLIYGKKIYPLKEFLDTPIDPFSIRNKFTRSLSNLFRSRKDCISPFRSSNEKAGNVSSSPSFLKALFKHKRAVVKPEKSHQRTKLEKFLHVFRKRNASQRSTGSQRSDINYVDVQEAFNSRNEMLALDLSDEVLSDASYQQDLLDELETLRFEEWSTDYNEQPWCRFEDDLPGNDNNGYWIKTDDEYVVLEL